MSDSGFGFGASEEVTYAVGDDGVEVVGTDEEVASTPISQDYLTVPVGPVLASIQAEFFQTDGDDPIAVRVVVGDYVLEIESDDSVTDEWQTVGEVEAVFNGDAESLVEIVAYLGDDAEGLVRNVRATFAYW